MVVKLSPVQVEARARTCQGGAGNSPLPPHPPYLPARRWRRGRHAAGALPLLRQPAARARALPGCLDSVSGGAQGGASGAAL
jgi:hypothetical protein